MTQGHRSDFYIAQRFLKQNVQPFLGVIGSRSKAATLQKELKKEGPKDEGFKEDIETLLEQAKKCGDILKKISDSENLSTKIISFRRDVLTVPNSISVFVLSSIESLKQFSIIFIIL